jgi:hypothetical protein
MQTGHSTGFHRRSLGPAGAGNGPPRSDERVDRGSIRTDDISQHLARPLDLESRVLERLRDLVSVPEHRGTGGPTGPVAEIADVVTHEEDGSSRRDCRADALQDATPLLAWKLEVRNEDEVERALAEGALDDVVDP